MALTKDDVKKLCEPLPLEGGHSVKVKAEAKPDAQKQWALWLVYTEEGPITERLDEVDPNWSLEIVDKLVDGNSATVYARLTICDVSRDCVGSGSNPNAGDAQKGAATDALKRGARLFGVGRYLLDAPQFYTDWAPKKRGNEWVRTRNQEANWETKAEGDFMVWYRETFGSQPQPAPRQSAPPSELDTIEQVVLVTSRSWPNINARLVDAGLADHSHHAYNRLKIIALSELKDYNEKTPFVAIEAAEWTEADLIAKIKARIAAKAKE
jgi:hypothetical protein